MNNYEFYKGRISSCPSYGFKSGHEIMEMVVNLAKEDITLTEQELYNIIKQADLCHKKLMEDNYNEGWNQNPER